MSIKPYLTLSVFLILFAACNKNTYDNPAVDLSGSVFIINEGLYPTGIGTISAFNRETLEVTNDIFETANGRPLGNVVQSLTVVGDKAFIVVNKTNKIEVVNLEDFKSVTTIDGLTLPRYFIELSDEKAYVSCWDSTVKVINLADYSISTSIPAGNGPDEMVIAGDKLFVINSGGYGVDSTVSVIQTNEDEFVGRITVGHVPSGIQKDINGKIWVLCSGKGWNGFPSGDDTPAKLVCIDPGSHDILKEIIFPDTENHPYNLIINGDGNMLYYNHPDGIFAFPVSSSGLNSQALINGSAMYYGLGYDDSKDMIYATDPLDNVQNGWVYRFNAADGSLVGSFMVGIIPNGFWFNN